MQLLEGKKGLILGVANQKSLAWGVANMCHQQGAELGFTYLNQQLERRVKPLAESVNSDFLMECDIQKDDDIDSVFASVKERWGKLDFIVHSIAYATGDDLKGRFVNTSREGFKIALDISAYSLIKVVSSAANAGVLTDGGSVLTLTYHGAEKVVPNYRVMGVAKAALEASVRELAVDLGADNIRVNAVSAGPVKTLAASGIADFRQLMGAFESRAPLAKFVTIEDVGKSAVYLLSDLSSAVTGEIHYVDCGFNITAA